MQSTFTHGTSKQSLNINLKQVSSAEEENIIEAQSNTPVIFGPFPFPPVLQRALVPAILRRDVSSLKVVTAEGDVLFCRHTKNGRWMAYFCIFACSCLLYTLFLSWRLEIFIAFHTADEFLTEELHVSSWSEVNDKFSPDLRHQRTSWEPKETMWYTWVVRMP